MYFGEYVFTNVTCWGLVAFKEIWRSKKISVLYGNIFDDIHARMFIFQPMKMTYGFLIRTGPYESLSSHNFSVCDVRGKTL